MSEDYPPTGDQVPKVPQVPEEQPPPAPAPVVSDGPSIFDAPPIPSLDAAPPLKQKVDGVFAIIGFFTPTVVLVAAGFILNWASTIGALVPLTGILGGVVQLLVVGGAIAAFVVGKRREDNRLRSFAIGALWSYVAYMLVALLAFGACLISLGSGGNFLGG